MLDSPVPPGARVVADGRFLDHLGSAADMVGARRFREAEVEVLRGLSISPADLRALKLLALVRFKLGRLDEARAVCRELAAAAPRDAGIRMKLGLIALKLHHIDEAVEELETAARLAPGDLRPWSYLGFAYARRGDRARAAAAFRRAGQEAYAVEAEGGGLASGPDAHQASGDSGGGRPEPAPAAPFEPAFDLSLPFDAREPGTEPDGLFNGPRSGAGELPVSPLVGYAVARLAPPADQAAWVGATARLAIGAEIFVCAEAAVACTGSARWEHAHRHVRGRPTLERLGGDDRPFFRVTGRGELFVAAPFGRLVPLRLDDDTLYVREDRVLAFEGTVAWEYGHVPRGDLRMLQFRGRGLVAIRVEGEPGAVKVTPDSPLFASSPHLLGWIGRVVAHGGEAGHRPAAMGGSWRAPFGITCEGEGVVLLDITQERGRGPGQGGDPRS